MAPVVLLRVNLLWSSEPMPQGQRARARRMQPDKRREMILDRTAELIAVEGLSAVSMERVAREVGSSKPLIYVHFPNRTSLLQALLRREQKRLLDAQAEALNGFNGSLLQLIELTTGVYLRHVEGNGLLVQRLMNEPAVAEAGLQADREDRRKTVDFLARRMSETLALPPAIAALATELSMGMTGAAGELISTGGAQPAEVEKVLLSLFRGGLNSLKTDFGRG